jgi:hypothetical protein
MAGFKMNNFTKKITIGLFSLLSFSGAANAELVSSHLNVIGDNLVTVDTSTGLEWLDTSLTRGDKYNDYKAGGFGFRLPTYEEFETLYINNLTEIENPYVAGSINLGYNSDDFAWMATLFSTNQTEINYEAVSIGIYKHERGDVEVFNINASSASGLSVNSGWRISSYFYKYGVMLVSDGGVSISSINDPSINQVSSVPLTSSIALFGLSGLLIFRKRKAK